MAPGQLQGVHRAVGLEEPRHLEAFLQGEAALAARAQPAVLAADVGVLLGDQQVAGRLPADDIIRMFRL